MSVAVYFPSVADTARTSVESAHPPHALITDHQLVTLHLTGDAHAFRSLAYRHHSYLWWLARRHSTSDEDAADSLQEAMLKAYQSLSTFRFDSQVRSWLHRIVVNACTDRLRRNKVRAAELLDEEQSNRLPDHRPCAFAEQDTRMIIAAALQHLPVAQREAIIAVDIDGLSIADAARRLGVEPGTVKSRRGRARAALKEVLEPHRHDLW